jgi:hypothetical protein
LAAKAWHLATWPERLAQLMLISEKAIVAKSIPMRRLWPAADGQGALEFQAISKIWVWLHHPIPSGIKIGIRPLFKV